MADDEKLHTCAGMVPDWLLDAATQGGKSPMTKTDALVQHGRAAAIAALAHRGQTDKIGRAYLEHPVRVADRFSLTGQPIEHCAALLHDVVEDSEFTLEDLGHAGIRAEIIEIVALLTRDKAVDDAIYYSRIRKHPRALAVKLADIDDNSAAWRVEQLERALQERLALKYQRARKALGADTSTG